MTTKQIIEDIFSQARKGKVEIKTTDGGFWTFYTRFATQINGELSEVGKKCPTINIPDFNSFEKLVDDYLVLARDFYAEDQAYFDVDDDEFSKKLFHDLMTNASNFDCCNIENFVKERMQMLASPALPKVVEMGQLQGKKLSMTVSKNHSNLEGPYRATFRFTDDNGENFELPTITFGITDKTCHLFAVQNMNVPKGTNHGKTEKPKVQKDIDRYFRKLNNGVDSEDIIANVSPNALASLTLFNSVIRQQGISELSSPIFMPLRYEGNKIAGCAKAKSEEERQEFLQKHDRDQFNITNKLTYLYLRYAYHFPETDCVYDETREKMTISLVKSSVREENIIYGLDRGFVLRKENIK